MTDHRSTDERPARARRRALQLTAPQPRRRRSPQALVASLLAHGAILAVVAQALEVPMRLVALLERERPPVQERITFVEPAVGGGGAPGAVPVPEPGVPAPVREAAPPPPRPAAPVETPTGLPVASPDAEPQPAAGVAAGSGDGSGVGRPGPAAGLQPTYTNSTVWSAGEARTTTELPSVAKKIESMIAEDFGALRDSIAAEEAVMRRARDWTIERDGQKWGIDEKYIRLGRLSIPTPLLGLLPIRVQANPTQADRARVYSEMARQSRDQGLRMRNDTDFRDVVQDIRARKDRERTERMAREAEARRQAGSQPPR